MVLPDREAPSEGYIRVVDESGEDYAYPSDLFCSSDTAGGHCATAQSASPLPLSPVRRARRTGPVKRSGTPASRPSGAVIEEGDCRATRI